jgi:hypothetical protein
MLTGPAQDHAGAVDPTPFGAARPGVRGRVRAVRFAIVAGALPVLASVATQFSSHRTLFFAGAAGGCAALIIVSALTRRLRPLFWLAEFGGIVAFTLMQAHTGGVASSYALLMLIAMMWLGLQATDGELAVGIAVLAACVFGPMLAIGAPAYPVEWGHAAVLFLAGASVAVTLRVVNREVQRLTRKLRQDALIDDLTGLLNRRG